MKKRLATLTRDLLRDLPGGAIRWGALFVLLLVFAAIIQVATWKPSKQFGSVQKALASTLTPTPTATATATATVSATPTPSPGVPSPAPTPIVAVAPGGCSLLSTTGLIAGVNWCQDQSSTPYVLYVWTGYKWLRTHTLPTGFTPPSSAANGALWLNTSRVPIELEQCNASACVSGNCTALCGNWYPLAIPNYVPHWP